MTHYSAGTAVRYNVLQNLFRTNLEQPTVWRYCRVVFRNQVRFPATIHVHGLLYNKSSEGSPYNDGTSGE